MTFLSNLKAKLLGSVDDIVGEFHATVNKLDARAKLHEETAKFHATVAELSQRASAAETAAAQRAGAIAAKIKSLVS